MSTDSLSRLLPAFGKVLVRYRVERKLTVEALADAIQLPFDEVERMERGHYGSTLPEFFRIADALGEQPTMLFIDLITAWRADAIGDLLHKSRASDFARLYRLGWYQASGEFQELPKSYDIISQARDGCRQLSALRVKKGSPPLDTICIYVRMGHVHFDAWENAT